MGAIKNLMITLAGMHIDCLGDDRQMREALSETEYEFYIENKDFIVELANELI